MRFAGLFLLCCCVQSSGCTGVSPDPAKASLRDVGVRVLRGDEAAVRDAQVEAAVAALLQRRHEDADAAAAAALSLDPRSARARAVRGVIAGRRANAMVPPDLHVANAGEVDLLQAVELAPDDPMVGWLHAKFLAEAGHLSAAAEAAEAALQRSREAPLVDRAELLGSAASYRYELGEERAALPHLQAYVGLRPDDALAHFRLGDCLLRIAAVPQGLRPNSLVVAQGRAEAAARAFARCCELSPDDLDAALAVTASQLRAAELARERADAPARQRHLQSARDWTLATAARFAAAAEPHFQLGALAELAGDADAARGHYGAALDRDRGHIASLLNLARLLGAAEREAAAALLQQVIARDAQQSVLSDAERKRILTWLDAGS